MPALLETGLRLTDSLTQRLGGPLIQAFSGNLRRDQRLGMKLWRHAQHQISRCRFFGGNTLFLALFNHKINCGFKVSA